MAVIFLLRHPYQPSGTHTSVFYSGFPDSSGAYKLLWHGSSPVLVSNNSDKAMKLSSSSASNNYYQPIMTVITQSWMYLLFSVHSQVHVGRLQHMRYQTCVVFSALVRRPDGITMNNSLTLFQNRPLVKCKKRFPKTKTETDEWTFELFWTPRDYENRPYILTTKMWNEKLNYLNLFYLHNYCLINNVRNSLFVCVLPKLFYI